MVVYKITNLTNGKVYVGQTVKTAMQRWQSHVWDAKNKTKNICPYFYRAIKKYGPENFWVEVLEECTDQVSMDKAEKSWIERLGATNSLKGYNVDFGGRCGGGLSPEGRERQQRARLGRPCSPETREKIRQAHLGKRLTGECKEKLRQAAKRQMGVPGAREAIGRRSMGNSYHLGKPHSEESREKIRIRAVERYKDPAFVEKMKRAYRHGGGRLRSVPAGGERG